MKKLIFALICALVVTMGVNAQQTGNPFGFGSVRMDPMKLSNQQIASILANSKESLNLSGVTNLDIIYPGKYVTFTLSFEDGRNEAIVHHVKKGDNLWNIVRYQLRDLVNKHGNPVRYNNENPEAKADLDPTLVHEVPQSTWFNEINIGTWLGILFICAILFMFYKAWSERRNPATSGRPMVPGGVSAEGATAHMQNLASTYFPGLNVANITRGRISANRALVSFADKLTGKTRTFENEPGYRGTVRRENGTEEFIYFLEVCGNRARRGDYFSGDILFVADTEQPEALRQTPATPVAEETVTENALVKTEKKPVVTDAQVQIVMHVCDLLKMKDNATVTIKPDGDVVLSFTKGAPTVNGFNLNKEQQPAQHAEVVS